jgi:hypothetical protein
MTEFDTTDIGPVRSVFLCDARSVRLLQPLLKQNVPTSSRGIGPFSSMECSV